MTTSKRGTRKKAGLVEFLEEVPDPRVDRTREHKLIDILVKRRAITSAGNLR